jgi:hypothetical protein
MFSFGIPAYLYAIASVYLLPNPPANGLVLVGNNDFTSFMMFALTLAACFRSSFLTA